MKIEEEDIQQLKNRLSNNVLIYRINDTLVKTRYVDNKGKFSWSLWGKNENGTFFRFKMNSRIKYAADATTFVNISDLYDDIFVITRKEAFPGTRQGKQVQFYARVKNKDLDVSEPFYNCLPPSNGMGRVLFDKSKFNYLTFDSFDQPCTYVKIKKDGFETLKDKENNKLILFRIGGDFQNGEAHVLTLKNKLATIDKSGHIIKYVRNPRTPLNHNSKTTKNGKDKQVTLDRF